MNSTIKGRRKTFSGAQRCHNKNFRVQKWLEKKFTEHQADDDLMIFLDSLVALILKIIFSFVLNFEVQVPSDAALVRV